MVESIAWSPNGNECSLGVHNSTLCTVMIKSDKTVDKMTTTCLNQFPFRSLIYKDDTHIIAGGYDSIPFVYERNGDDWYL